MFWPASPKHMTWEQIKRLQLIMCFPCRRVFTVCKLTLQHTAMSLMVSQHAVRQCVASSSGTLSFCVCVESLCGLLKGLCWVPKLFFCAGPPEQFDNWLSGFRLDEKKGEISELLVNTPSIRALYTKMVSIAALASHNHMEPSLHLI